MIAVIIGSVLFVLGAIILIVGIIGGSENVAGLGIVGIVVCAFLIPVCLITGRSIHKKDISKDLLRKEQIEYLLENAPSLYTVEEARKYNNSIEEGNNYLCRFTREDRSEYKIDIDSYIKEWKNDDN